MAYRIEIANPWYKQVALITGVFLLSVLGWHLLVQDDLFAKAVGFVCVVVFSGFGGIAIARRMAGNTRIAVSRTGLEMQSRRCTGPIFIPWSEIDGIAVRSIAGTEMVCLSLGSYDGMVTRSSVDQMELVANERADMIARLKLPTVEPEIRMEHAAETDRRIWRHEGIRVFVDTMRMSRQMFGAEFMLPRNMLDRPAEQFATFLVRKRKLFARTA